jgi:hypothetical protein
MHLTLKGPGNGKRTNEVHWDFKTSRLPWGGFLFNRSRTVVAVHNGNDVILYDSKSLSALDQAHFSNPRIRSEKMAKAYLADDCSLLFVEWDKYETNGISIFDQKGIERFATLPRDTWLVDGENTLEGVTLMFRDGADGATILRNEVDSKEFRAQNIDRTVWDYKRGVIYFLGNLDGLANSDRIVSWDYKGQTSRTGTLKL